MASSKERLEELKKLNEQGADSARAAGKEPDWAKPKVKKFKKGGMVDDRSKYGKK